MSRDDHRDPGRTPVPEDIPRRPYRRGVGVMLLNREGRVFVAQRIGATSAAWQMPQGGIDGGEDPREAALRELREEIGTTLVEVIAESRMWRRYDLPVEYASRVWGGRYRGQEQKWFAMRFLGDDDDIDIVTDDPEFSAWRWVDMDELPQLIVPFKRQVYVELVSEFRHLAEAARAR